MEAGTGLRWREEGILVVTRKKKKPEHTVQSSRFIGGDVFNEKSGVISCSCAGLAKYLGRVSFHHYTRRLGQLMLPRAGSWQMSGLGCALL